MFEKITHFIRTFFELIFKDLKGLFSSKKEEEIVIVEPAPEDLEPQDGADIPQDTVVVVDTKLEEVVVIPEEKSTSPEIVPEEEPDQPTTPPIVITESEEETPEKEESASSKQRFLWCLDNGHGKLTAGKRSPKLKDGSRFFEYEFNRIIVKGIIKELKKYGVRYYNVVPEVNVDNFLQGRVLRANNVPSDIPKIFLSVHANAGPGMWTSANGLETWFFHGSRTGRKLAAVFQQQLVNKLGWTNRGIKSQPTKQFYVLRRTNMPAVLTENGFYNNRTEVYKLSDSAVQKKIIAAHVETILYFEKYGI
ncbi:MAG: N-acetylmuramoyl-L-alanine amidase [Bacteroidota bacterium]